VAWAIVELAPNAILLVDPEGRIVLANAQADDLFAYGPDGLVGREVDDLVPESLRARHRSHRAAYGADPHTRPMGMGLDLQAARADETTFPVEIALSPIDVDGVPHVVAVVRDITDRLEAERKLQAAQREVSVLADRERIARDLHDSVIQRLFAAGMSLQATAGRAEPAVQERISGVVEDLDATIRELRQAIFQLTAHTLDPHSIRRQVLDVADQAAEALGFEPALRLDGPLESLDGEQAEHLLAVLREALTNVARHAQATEAQVTISVGDELELVVRDDGRGVDPDATPGRGTANLEDRASALGGTVEVVPAEVRGTVVRWTVPLGR
jgi:PAS domain S-box-containing protein